MASVGLARQTPRTSHFTEKEEPDSLTRLKSPDRFRLTSLRGDVSMREAWGEEASKSKHGRSTGVDASVKAAVLMRFRLPCELRHASP